MQACRDRAQRARVPLQVGIPPPQMRSAAARRGHGAWALGAVVRWGLGAAGSGACRGRAALSRPLATSAPADFSSLVTAQHKELVRRQRAALAELRQAIVAITADEADLRLLDETTDQLDDLFLLCVVGEFNAGKSSIINALLGKRHLKDGVTPTTDRVYMIKHPAAAARQQRVVTGQPRPVVLELPVPWLAGISIVDTPGTNSVDDEHTAITDAIIPKCDLVLFCTSVDRPFSESERVFLKRIAGWGKKVVFVLNKADLLSAENGAAAGDLQAATKYVRSVASQVLGPSADVKVFPVSARKSLALKEAGALLSGSDNQAAAEMIAGSDLGFAALESFILASLAGPDKIKWKLSSPLGVAATVAAKYEGRVAAQKRVVAADAAVLESLERQNATYRADMQRDFGLQAALVHNELLQMATRADDWLEENVSLMNAAALLSPGSLREAFEAEVLRDTTSRVDTRVRDLVDWMVEKTARQAAAVIDHVHTHGVQRRAEVEREMIGTIGQSFESNRQALVKTLQRDVASAVEVYDSRREATKLAEALRTTVFSAVALEASAVGVGGLVAAATLDFSGLAASGLLATTGLLILPYQRQQLKRQFRASVVTLQEEVDAAIATHLDAELEASMAQIKASFSPYSVYVRTERKRSGEHEAEISRLAAELGEIADEIKALNGGGS